MENLFAEIAAIGGGIFVFYLAYKYFAKEKFGFSSMLVPFGVVLILFSFPGFQGFIKAFIDSKVTQKLNEIGNQVNQVQATTTSMQDELNDHQKQIDSHQTELNTVQTNVRNAQIDIAIQQTNVESQYKKISTVQNDLSSAQTNLNEQAIKIADVEYLVDNLFSHMTNDDIAGTDTNRVCRVSNRGMVFFKLRNVPIHNSVHLIEQKSGAGNSALVLNTVQFLNIVSFNFDGDWSLWKDGNFNFEYVVDARQTNMIQNFETSSNELVLEHSLRIKIP